LTVAGLPKHCRCRLRIPPDIVPRGSLDAVMTHQDHEDLRHDPGRPPLAEASPQVMSAGVFRWACSRPMPADLWSRPPLVVELPRRRPSRRSLKQPGPSGAGEDGADASELLAAKKSAARFSNPKSHLKESVDHDDRNLE